MQDEGLRVPPPSRCRACSGAVPLPVRQLESCPHSSSCARFVVTLLHSAHLIAAVCTNCRRTSLHSCIATGLLVRRPRHRLRFSLH